MPKLPLPSALLPAVLFPAALFFAFVATVALLSTPGFASDSKDRSPHEIVGKVFGKPIYRSDLEANSKSEFRQKAADLFLDPIWQQYVDEHRAEIEPNPDELIRIAQKLREQQPDSENLEKPLTAEELLAKAKEDIASLESDIIKLKKMTPLELQFEQIELEPGDIERMEEGLAVRKQMTDAELLEFARQEYGPELEQLEKFLSQISELSASEREQQGITDATIASMKSELEIARMEQKHPQYRLAHFMYGHWKFEKHLYDNFGGGRVAWQQRGMEAFDAARRFIEMQEQAKNFEVYDAEVRDAVYSYWTHSRPPIMYEKPEEIEAHFLKPDWLVGSGDARNNSGTVLK